MHVRTDHASKVAQLALHSSAAALQWFLQIVTGGVKAN
jgi:hypothetical protein